MTRLSLLHLSDIHLNRRHAEKWDPDEELRNELVLDMERLRARGAAVDGVVVTGDLAFSGKTAEFDSAAGLLGTVCRAVGCPVENVWVVPGNHDVDRDAIASSRVLSTLHDSVRSAADDELDRRLEVLLTDPTAGEMLLRPLDAYNTFASRYRCAISAQVPYWEDELPLGHGYRLRMRGITTVLVSDHRDDDAANRLALPRMQCAFLREPGTVWMVLGHHPVSWLRRSDVLTTALRPHARVQAYGHRHAYWARTADENVEIFAGALHPDRREPPWEPHFNIVTLGVRLAEGEALLAVEVEGRRWFADEGAFGPDRGPSGDEVKRFELSLGQALAAPNGGRPEEAPMSEDLESEALGTARRTTRRSRTLAFRFSELPYQVRLDIARRLGFVADDTPPMSEPQLLEHVSRAAQSEDASTRLWDEVASRHPHAEDIGPNPYRES